MIYVRNLPLWERLLRIGAGTVAAAYAFLSIGGVMGWVILAAGAGTVLTGIFGFCPACALAGRRLEKRLQQRPVVGEYCGALANLRKPQE